MAEANNDDTDRSEDPTQKRLDEALERGDVVKSQEVNTWFVIAGGTLVLMAFSAARWAGPDRDAARPDRQLPPDSASTAAALLGGARQDRASRCWPRSRSRCSC